jgi:hypothetical protein
MNNDNTPMRILPRLVSPTEQPSVPFIDGQLHIGLLVDDGVVVRPVTENDLLIWRTSIEALMPKAIEALGSNTDWRDWQAVHTVPGMELYLAGDGLSSSRMLIMEQLVHAWPFGGVVVAVPSADQLMAVRLDSVSDLDALNVMVTAAHYASIQSENGLSDQVFWHDGERWHHLDVVHNLRSVEIDPPAAFMDAIGHLAAMGMVMAAGEA